MKQRRGSIRLAGAYTAAALLTALLAGAGFGTIALLLYHPWVTDFDHAIIGQVQSWEAPWLTRTMHFFSAIGTGVPLALLTAAVMALQFFGLKHRRELALLLVAVIGSSLLNVALKVLFQRARPMLRRLAEASGYSFPSGHSMAAFTFYGIVAFLIWRHVASPAWKAVVIALSAAFILTIGISRIYLGVHYPSDVLGGYLASACWLSALIWCYHFFMSKASAISS